MAAAKALRNLDFPEGRRTPFAYRRITSILADMRRVVPAALTFGAVGLLNRHFERWHQFGLVLGSACGQEIDLRDDEQARQLRQVVLEFCPQFRIAAEEHFGFESGIDALFAARSLESLQNLGTDLGQQLPIR